MSVEEAFADHIAANDAVIALVASRIYLLKLPQSPTLPAVRVQLIDEPESYHTRGANAETRAEIQVDTFAQEGGSADPYRTATAVAEAIETAVSGKTFETADRRFTAVYQRSRRALYDPDELRLVRVMTEYVVWSQPV